jgi:hypothetical protein
MFFMRQKHWDYLVTQQRIIEYLLCVRYSARVFEVLVFVLFCFAFVVPGMEPRASLTQGQC